MNRVINEIRNFPICVFGYNRPEHLKKCLNSLASCSEAIYSDLYIFCDGPKNDCVKQLCDAVALIAVQEKGNKRFHKVVVVISPRNKGLAQSIITGVTGVIKKYGACIVVEDDLVVSPYYLKYMNEALNYYKKDNRIWSITGYTYPLKNLECYQKDVYLSYRICSYGWGTWRDRWEKVDWEIKDYEAFSHSIKKIREFNRGGNDMFRTLKKCVKKGYDIWAIRFSYAQFRNDMFTVYPRKTLISNHGYDGSGTNGQVTEEYEKLCIDPDFKDFRFDDVELNKKILKEFSSLYRASIKEWLKYKIKCLKAKGS